jgi:hypothetical protein
MKKSLKGKDYGNRKSKEGRILKMMANKMFQSLAVFLCQMRECARVDT